MSLNSHLLVIYSCRKFEDTRVRWQEKTWPQRLPPQLQYLKMTGDGNGSIDEKGILRLDCKDGYAKLVDKTQALFDWFLHEREETWLIKCDDDVWLSPRALQKIVDSQDEYVASFGRDYANGPIYMLHRDLIAKLPRLRDYGRQLPRGKIISEDKAVGAAVRLVGAELNWFGFDKIHWYKHKEDQLSGSHSWDMAFCFTRHEHEQLMHYCENNYKSE